MFQIDFCCFIIVSSVYNVNQCDYSEIKAAYLVGHTYNADRFDGRPDTTIGLLIAVGSDLWTPITHSFVRRQRPSRICGMVS